MENSSSWEKKRAMQRQTAEAMVANLFPENAAPESSGMLVHELLVHKIELEMQIIELQDNAALVEKMRDQYADLYETASVGLISTDAKGIVKQINMSAVGLLGASKAEIIGSAIDRFIEKTDRKPWLLFFEKILYTKENPVGNIVVSLSHRGKNHRLVHIDCQRKYVVGTGILLHLTLADLNKIKLAEAEMLDKPLMAQ